MAVVKHRNHHSSNCAVATPRTLRILVKRDHKQEKVKFVSIGKYFAVDFVGWEFLLLPIRLLWGIAPILLPTLFWLDGG